MSGSATTVSTSDWSLYPYNPVKPLPFIFAVLIGLLGLVNIYQSFFKYRWKKFGFIMTWASLVWVAGFACRAYSQYHVQDIGMYIAQFVLVIMGPTLYAASETFILGRILAYLPYLSPIHPGRVISTFLIFSAVIEALTGNGSAKAANAQATPAQQQAGLTLIKVALILQAALEMTFFTLTAALHRRASKAGTLPRQVRVMLYVIYITSSMVFVRCVVRVVEGFEAAGCVADPLHRCGVVPTHEVFLWVFEVANITLFVIILTIFTPGRFLPHSDRVFLDPRDGKTERLGPGYSNADRRPLLCTFLDPFDLVGIVSGKGRSVQQFWLEDQPEYVGQEVVDTRKKASILPSYGKESP